MKPLFNKPVDNKPKPFTLDELLDTFMSIDTIVIDSIKGDLDKLREALKLILKAKVETINFFYNSGDLTEKKMSRIRAAEQELKLMADYVKLSDEYCKSLKAENAGLIFRVGEESKRANEWHLEYIRELNSHSDTMQVNYEIFLKVSNQL